MIRIPVDIKYGNYLIFWEPVDKVYAFMHKDFNADAGRPVVADGTVDERFGWGQDIEHCEEQINALEGL